MSDGDAEEAFEHLRGEVALLRRAIEGLLADPVKSLRKFPGNCARSRPN